MTVLVTGGAGFIGSELVRQLVSRGEMVINVDKLTYAGHLANVREVIDNPLHRFVQADVCEGLRMLELLREHQPRTIYHLAAESHVDRSIDGPADFVQTNVAGTAALLEAAREYGRSVEPAEWDRFRYIQVSTDEVYGELGADGAFTEASPYRPNSPYSATKAAGDHLARAWHRTYKLPVIVSNCSNNYGPYQHPEKLIPLVILNGLEGRPLPVYGTGLNVRDWLHVSDHAAALQRLAAQGRIGETYLIGARNERRNIDVVRAVCDALDRLHPGGAPHARLIEFVTDRPGHDARYAIDPTWIETSLGWRAAVDFRDGLFQTVSWYIGHRDWCAEVAGTYGRERLGRAA